MAFEYMVASYLVANNMAGLFNVTRYMNLLGYTKLPSLLEQALFLRKDVMKQETNLNGYEISEQTQNLFDHVYSIFTKYSGDKTAAEKELTVAYGHTFLFYNLYGYCR
jgi:hypothetical protein